MLNSLDPGLFYVDVSNHNSRSSFYTTKSKDNNELDLSRSFFTFELSTEGMNPAKYSSTKKKNVLSVNHSING